MEKSLVSAARWLGICMVVSSFILTLGMGDIAKRLGGNRSQNLSLSGMPGRIELVTPSQVQVAPIALRLDGSSGSPLQIEIRDKTIAKPAAKPAAEPQ